MLLSLVPDQRGLRIIGSVANKLSVRDRELERGQMPALEEVVQVRGREGKLTIALLHCPIVTERSARSAWQLTPHAPGHAAS
jgi:hypothetical protein